MEIKTNQKSLLLLCRAGVPYSKVRKNSIVLHPTEIPYIKYSYFFYLDIMTFQRE